MIIILEKAEPIHIGILCAMPEELGSTLKNLVNLKKKRFGDLEILSGKWNSQNKKKSNVYLSIAWSGWGKVSAARAATRLLSMKYENEEVAMIFFFLPEL